MTMKIEGNYIPNKTQNRPSAIEGLQLNTEAINMLKSKTSNTRLEELDFDPIEALVKQLEDVEKLLALEMTYGSKSRQAIVAALIVNRTKIVEALLPYGYSKVVAIEETPKDRESFKIILYKEE
jgi:hypothetical protein